MNDKQLATALKFYKEAGVFTHAFAATGRLDSTVAAVKAAELPDDRSLFDLASTTKALVTTPLCFSLQRSAGLDLRSSIGDFLEEKAADLDSRLRALSIRSLLRHESGLPAWRNFWVCRLGPAESTTTKTQALAIERENCLVERLNRIASTLPKRQGPQRQGDQAQVYSDVGFLLLGLALERHRGKNLAVQFAEFCSNELGINALQLPLAYGPCFSRTELAQKAIPTGYCAVRQRQLVGEVHDENCASLGGITAHSGLFGSGEALVMYLKALFRSDTGKLLLQENARQVIAPKADVQVNDSLLGWRQGSDPVAAKFAGGRSMGHYGFTGTAFWVDPDTWKFCVLLTNRVIAGRVPRKSEPNSPQIGIAECRKQLFEIMNKT